MATVVSESYETGSVGATVSTSNTGFNQITRQPTPTPPPLVFATGGVAGNCATMTLDTTQLCYCQYNWTQNASAWARCYFKMSAIPATGVFGILSFFDSAASAAARIVAQTVSGVARFRLQDSTTTRTTTTTVSCPVDEWFRVEMSMVGTATTARFFIGANLNGTTPDETLTATMVIQPSWNRIRFGTTNSPISNMTMSLDEAAVDDASFPAPVVTAPPAGTVTYTMSGAATEDAAIITGKFSGGSSIRVGYSTNSGLTSPSFSSAAAPDSDGYVSVELTSLSANTKYYYQYFDTPTGGDEEAIGSICSFRTHTATNSTDTVNVAVSSCIKTATTQATDAFGSIVDWDPHYFIHLGDAYYNGTQSTDATVHRGKWETQIAAVPDWADCMAAVAQEYINSDHELNPDDADTNTTGAAAFNQFFQETIPARLVDTASPPAGKYRSWVDSNIRFIFLDIRNTDRSTGTDTDDSSKTMLGATQKTWLKSELLEEEPLKVIISDVPWSGTATLANGEDKWWAYSTERQEIADFITDNEVNVDFIHGDSHRIAVDETHNSWGGFPVLCCSGLSQDGAGAETNGTQDDFFNNSGGEISTYMRLTYEWLDSSTIQRTASGWDAVADTERVNQVFTWDVTPAVEIVPGQVYKRVAGAWTLIDPKKRAAGAWSDAQAYKRVSGAWTPSISTPAELLWQASPDADTGSSSSLTLTITAPSSGVSDTDQVLLLVNGVTPIPTTVAVSGSGVTSTTLVTPVTVSNEWWAAYLLTGLDNSTVITATITSTAKFFDMMMVGYSGAGVGNVSTAFARPSSSNLSTLPAFTLQDADSTVVDLWAERNTLGTTSLAVDTGTIRRQFKGTGTTTGHIAVSDYMPGSTSAGAVVGTYTNGAGTNRSAVSGAGIQIEMLPGIGSIPSTPATLTSMAVGGVDSTSAQFRMDTADVDSGATVLAATNSTLTTGLVESASSTPDSDGVLMRTLTGLTPGTDYYYTVRLNGTVNAARGQFRTPPSTTEQSFSFLAASCVGTSADPVLFNFMRARTGPTGKTADFFVHLGDLEYLDLSSSSSTDYLNAFRGAFAKTNQKALFNAMQVEYTISDHDAWGPNCDAETAAAGVVDAWRTAFAQYWPTYDLPASDGGIFRSWVRGRVRFILTDGRTYMSDIAATDNSSKTKLGTEQKQWWKDECQAAKDAGQVIIWLNEDAWDPSSAFVGDDSWAAYDTERDELVAYLAANSIDQIMIIHGDYHALAADDGTNSPGSIPIACASPMSQSYFLASQSHWSEGSYPPSGTAGTLNQYGWFDVTDSGDSITVDFTGFSNDGTADTSRITLSVVWDM